MGLLGKMKSAITGGGAMVSIEYPTEPVRPGTKMHVKVTVVSQGNDFKSKGVFVDLRGREHGYVKGQNRCPKCGEYDHSVRVAVSHNTFDQSFPVTGAFTLQENETKEFEKDIAIPSNAQPTYHGVIEHEWEIRGRLEAFGNDPDSGFQKFVVK